MRKLVAPLFVVAVLGFVAYAGLVVADLDPNGDGLRSSVTLPGWQGLAFAGWLLLCAGGVVGGTLAARRTTRRRRRG